MKSLGASVFVNGQRCSMSPSRERPRVPGEFALTVEANHVELRDGGACASIVLGHFITPAESRTHHRIVGGTTPVVISGAVEGEVAMIRLWVLLEDEPPMTAVTVGGRASFTCRWVAMPAGIPEEFLAEIPGVDVVERNGDVLVVSGESGVFAAVPDSGQADVGEVRRPGLAFEDRYLWTSVHTAPEFDGVVEKVRYLWSTTGPGGVVEHVTEHATNDFPGNLAAAGKVVLVAVD